MIYEKWLNDWLENYVRTTSKSKTYHRYVEIVSQHVKPNLGTYEMDNLTPIIIQKFISGLLQNGNIKTGEGLSPNSVNCIVTVVQNSIKTAYRLGFTTKNCTDKIKRPKLYEKKVECFSLTDQKKIEKYVLNTKKPKLMGIILCLYTGLRIGELLALEWSDVDFVNSEIKVNKSCHDGKDEYGVFKRLIDSPKTNASTRTIPLPKQLLPLLRSIKKDSESNYVISNKSKPIAVRSYQRSFALIQKKLDVRHRGFHALRHTFATRALECGMDVKALSEILGHKSPTVTLNCYVHSLMEHKKELMNRIGKLL